MSTGPIFQVGQAVSSPTFLSIAGILMGTKDWPDQNLYLLDDDGVERYQAALAAAKFRLFPVVEEQREEINFLLFKQYSNQVLIKNHSVRSFWQPEEGKAYHLDVDTEIITLWRHKETSGGWFEYKGPSDLIDPKYEYKKAIRITTPKA